jgi:hypothetical protein
MNLDRSAEAKPFFGSRNGVRTSHVDRFGTSDSCLWECELRDGRAGLVEVSRCLRMEAE